MLVVAAVVTAGRVFVDGVTNGDEVTAAVGGAGNKGGDGGSGGLAAYRESAGTGGTAGVGGWRRRR